VNRKEGKPTTKPDGTVRYPKRPVLNVRKQLFKPMFTDLTKRAPERPDSFPHPWVEKMFDKDFKFRPVILKKVNGDTVPFDKSNVRSGDVCAGLLGFETRYSPGQAVPLKIEVQPEVIYFLKKGSFSSHQDENPDEVAEEHPVALHWAPDEYVAPVNTDVIAPFEDSFIAKKAKKDEVLPPAAAASSSSSTVEARA